MKTLNEWSAWWYWVLIFSSLYLFGRRLFRGQHLLWSLLQGLPEGSCRGKGLNWRNTRSWGRSLLVVRSPSLWSDAETARRLCLLCEAEQKACLFVLGLCQMWETWVLYNVNFPAVLKYANQGGKGVVFAVSMFPPTWHTYSGNVLSWEKGIVRHFPALHFFCPATAFL